MPCFDRHVATLIFPVHPLRLVPLTKWELNVNMVIDAASSPTRHRVVALQLGTTIGGIDWGIDVWVTRAGPTRGEQDRHQDPVCRNSPRSVMTCSPHVIASVGILRCKRIDLASQNHYKSYCVACSALLAGHCTIELRGRVQMLFFWVS